MPTLYQRFSEYGQAGLQPEESHNVELGLHWQNQGNRFGLTAYHTRIRNLISFGAAGPCASAWGCYENTGRAKLQGVTLSGAYQLGRVNLHGSLDVQKPRAMPTPVNCWRAVRGACSTGGLIPHSPPASELDGGDRKCRHRAGVMTMLPTPEEWAAMA